MPLIPLFAVLVALVFSGGIKVFWLVKNLLLWSLWIYALLRLRKSFALADHWVLLAAAVILFVPYNLNIACQMDIEEGYLVALLGLLYVLLVTGRSRWDFAALGALVAAIYLAKSSMFLVCGVAVLWVLVAMWKKDRLAAILPGVLLAAAILGWGGFIHARTGVFAVGADASSWNGGNYYKGNNAKVPALYPRITLDTLDSTGFLLPTTEVKNEWELNHAQMAMGRKYMMSHPGQTLRMDAIKLWVACCDLRESPEHTPGHTRPMVMMSNGVNHLLFDIVALLACVHILRRRGSQAEWLFLLLVSAYLAPYFTGFLYMRHMVPLYGLAAILLALQLSAKTQSPADGEQV